MGKRLVDLLQARSCFDFLKKEDGERGPERCARKGAKGREAANQAAFARPERSQRQPFCFSGRVICRRAVYSSFSRRPALQPGMPGALPE